MLSPSSLNQFTKGSAPNTLRVLYFGRILVLNGKQRFARATYFIKRDLELSNTHIIYKGVCFYPILKDMVDMQSVKNMSAPFKLTA
jgi:hypothetical protein